MHLKSKKILVVEDDKSFSEVLALRLELAGYEVLTAPNGFEGVKLTMCERPDLIVTDIWMPVGMGFSVAERLHELGFSDIPIIFMTGSKLEGLREAALSIGGAGFFEKPYRSEALLKAIAAALESNRKMRSAKNTKSQPDGLRVATSTGTKTGTSSEFCESHARVRTGERTPRKPLRHSKSALKTGDSVQMVATS